MRGGEPYLLSRMGATMDYLIVAFVLLVGWTVLWAIGRSVMELILFWLLIRHDEEVTKYDFDGLD